MSEPNTEFLSLPAECESLERLIAAIDAEARKHTERAEQIAQEFKALKDSAISGIRQDWKEWGRLSKSQRLMAGGERMRFFSLTLEFRPAQDGKGLVLAWRRSFVVKGTAGAPTRRVGSKYLAPDKRTKTYAEDTLRPLVPEEVFPEVWALERRAQRLRQAQTYLATARRGLALRVASLRKQLAMDDEIPM